MLLGPSLLGDELALMEIHKHKWIESEKSGREIGFATAAWDWINKYGEAWKQFRLKTNNQNNIFTERRLYRRFPFNCPVQLKIEEQCIASFTKEVNLIGLSCTLPRYIPQNTEALMTLSLNQETAQPVQSKICFPSRILRISPPREKESSLSYEVFLPFNEQARDFLRNNAGLLKN